MSCQQKADVFACYPVVFPAQFLARSQCLMCALKEGKREGSRRGTEQAQMERGQWTVEGLCWEVQTGCGRGTEGGGLHILPLHSSLTWTSPSGDFSGHLPWLLASFQMGDHVWLTDRRPCSWGGSSMALCAWVLQNQTTGQDSPQNSMGWH